MWSLGTFRDGGPAFAGLVLENENVIDLTSDGWSSTAHILDHWSDAVASLHEIASRRGDDAVALTSLHVEAPVTPTQVLQSGANYRLHVIDIIMAEERARAVLDESQAREMANGIMDERVASGEPYLFFGTSTAMCGPYDDVILPDYGEQHDWELELAVVIGRAGTNVAPSQAFDLVAGYTIVNDITTRDLVYRSDLKAIGTDWLRAKNAPTFLPTGPFLVPKEFVEDPSTLTITLTLNGEPMQSGPTSDMIFDVAELVSYASKRVLLRPGDLLLTGSPAGNGMHHGRFLQAGDVMEGTITSLGTQRNRCVAARDLP